MAYGYRRRRYRRRRNYKKRRAVTKYRRPKDTFDYARQAWKAAMEIKRVINVETKYFLYTESGIAADFNWDIRNIVGVPQGGDTNERRDGNSIKPLNLTGRFTVKLAAAGTTASESVFRLIILRGKHEQGDGTTEYINAYEDGSTADDILKFKLDDTKFNSQTLMDKTYHFQRSLSGNQSRFQRDFNIRLTGHINYPDATTAPEDGGIYALFVWSGASGTLSGITFDWHSKLTFTDN